MQLRATEDFELNRSVICASLSRENSTFSSAKDELEWEEKGTSDRREIFNQRISVNSKVTKCPPQHSVQFVMRPLVNFEKEALTFGLSLPISFIPFILIPYFKFVQNNLTFGPHNRTSIFL